MSIATRINEMSSHIEQAYNELQGLGADLTNVNKNIENISMILDNIYDSMPQVSGEGTSLTLDNTRVGKIKSTLKGNTSQSGTPTPDYPQEIQVVTGDNSIDVCGKNLLSTSFELGTINVYGMPGGATNRARTGYEEVQPNKTYIFSSSNLNIYFVPYFYDESYTFISYDNGWKAQTTTITTPSNTKYLRLLVKNNLTDTITLGEITQPQLEQRSTATTYEPYQSQSYHVSLGNIELCKIGNYQDYFYEDSDKWYWHKEIGKRVLDGNENWSYQQAQKRFYINVSDAIIENVRHMVYSNYYRYLESGNADGIIFTNGTTLYLYNYSYTSVNELKNWLSTHNTEAYYILETPTNTEITYQPLIDQLNKLRKAISYENQTNISQINDNLPFIINASALMKNSD